MAELAQAQSILKQTLDKVAALEAQLDAANSKKARRTERITYMHTGCRSGTSA